MNEPELNEREWIERLPLFAALPDEEMQKLVEVLHLRSYPARHVLFYEGEIGDSFAILLEGEVEILKALGAEDERIMAVLGEGEFIGEMSLLYQGRRRSATARTRTPVRALEMTHPDFIALLKRQPVLAFRIMQEMSERLRDSEDATIRDLLEKNSQLAQAYQELKATQAQLIEKEKMEHELRMARKIQESILPKTLPAFPGWRLAAHWQPARAVSGDFYDFLPLPDGRLGLVVGDVTDKGVPAALVMATTRSVLRSVMLDTSLSPGQVLARVNNLLCGDMPPHMFVTCLYAVLDLDSGHLVFANAGHNLPFQHTAQGGAELRARGMPLGLMPDMAYEETESVLAQGDYLLLYSDGLVEAHNPQAEMFGFPRLLERLAFYAGLGDSSTPLIAFLLNELTSFTGQGWEQEDDVTLVTLERFPSS